ncbi:MAG: hypothetical protein KDI31_09180, partial [Pseudomonadales bacterium]|nr:hypothetical protein [Pseudomonadales bacterium]
ARFKQPKAVINVEALPRNAMGKVQKNALRSQYADLFPAAPAGGGVGKDSRGSKENKEREEGAGP